MNKDGNDPLLPVDVFSTSFRQKLDSISPLDLIADLRTDQLQRFQNGTPVAVEDYLAQFAPHLDDELTVDLIYSEVLLRARFGKRPVVDEYVERFPSHAEALRDQFELFEALNGTSLADLVDEEASESTLPKVSARSQASDLPLPTIPGYQMETLLGSGGMGVVYRAKHLKLKRTVALKTLHASTLGEAITRFQTEAECIARLHHPNIVQIYEIGDFDHRPFFSMEYVDGGNLAEHLAGKPQAPRWAARIVAQVADAVHTAHQAGIIHRDLKPTNILLSHPLATTGSSTQIRHTPVPKVTDFGLARQLDADSAHTQTGQILGTPSYMAPEQAEGRTADVGPATDVFALGTILYEILTGKVPFDGSNVVTTLAKVRTEEPTRPTLISPRIHRDLETICLKCLRKNVASRYPTSEALRDDLHRFLEGLPVEARPVSRLQRAWNWCRRRPAAAFATFLVSVVLVVFLPALAWYQSRLAQSKQKERTAKQLADSADRARRAALELAQTQKYFSLVSRTRERTVEKPMGWTFAGLKDLHRAASLDTTSRDWLQLRQAAARCLAGIDLRRSATWADGLPQVMLAFSHDGRRLAVADYRSTSFFLPCGVSILDTDTGHTVQRLSFPSSQVLKSLIQVPDGTRSLTFTRSGRQLLAGSRSGWMYRWHLDADRAQQKPDSWKVLSAPVDWLLLTPQKNEVIVGSRDATRVSRWNLSTGRKIASVEMPADLRGLTHVSGKPWILCQSDHRSVFLDADTLQSTKQRPIQGNLGPFSYNQAGNLLVGSRRGQIAFIHPESRREVKTFGDPETGVAHARPNLIRLNQDASLVLSLSYVDDDRTLRLWEVASGDLVATLPLQGKDFANAAFHPTKNSLAVAHGGKLELYQIAGLEPLRRLANQSLPVDSFALSPTADLLICAAAAKVGLLPLRGVNLWRLPYGRFDAAIPRYHLVNHPPETSLIAVRPHSHELAVLTHSSTIDCWNDQKHQPTEAFPLRSRASAIQFDTTGKRLWVIEDQKKMLQSYLWKTGKKSLFWQDSLRLAEGTGELYSLDISQKYIAVGSREGVTLLLRASDTSLEKEFAGSRSPIRAVAIHPQETLIASGSHQGVVRIFQISSGKLLTTLKDHRRPVQSIDFSPDGQWLATGSADGSIYLYVLAQGSWHKWITFRSGPVRQIRFHPDGHRLFFTVRNEPAVRVWDLQRLKKRFDKMGIRNAVH